MSASKTERKLKTKIHFNRIAMARKDPRVWSAHNSRACNMAEKVVVVHNGQKVLETVFNPEGKQPRAYLVAYGKVRHEGKTAIVEV
jgi:hypothetical protein